MHFIWVQDFSSQAIKHFASHKVTSTHISNSQSNSGTNCIHQQSLNNCWNQIDTRFMEVDIEISLWRWLVTWLCADGWRAEDDCFVKLLLRLEANIHEHWGPCIHRINSVYCILSTDTYTMLMSGGVIRKIHCIVLYCIFIQIQSLIETIEVPTIFLFIRDTANVVCKINTSVLQPSAEGSKVLRRWVLFIL